MPSAFGLLCGTLRQLVPDDHVLIRVDRVLDLSWLRDEVADCYCPDDGRPGIDPEAAVRLPLAGLLSEIVYDRRLMHEAPTLPVGSNWMRDTSTIASQDTLAGMRRPPFPSEASGSVWQIRCVLLVVASSGDGSAFGRAVHRHPSVARDGEKQRWRLWRRQSSAMWRLGASRSSSPAMPTSANKA